MASSSHTKAFFQNGSPHWAKRFLGHALSPFQRLCVDCAGAVRAANGYKAPRICPDADSESDFYQRLPERRTQRDIVSDRQPASVSTCRDKGQQSGKVEAGCSAGCETPSRDSAPLSLMCIRISTIASPVVMRSARRWAEGSRQ